MKSSSKQKHSLSKFRALSWSERWLLAKVFAVLVAYKLLLLVVPFSALFRQSTHPTHIAAVFSDEQLNRIIWAIQTLSARIPLGFTCLVQALSAKWLVHNHPAVRVCIGVQKNPQHGFAAHAWVVYKDKTVLGEQANQVFEPILHWN